MSQQRDCKSTIERAFEIAESQSVSSIDQLVRTLQTEGYSTNMLIGPLLMKQLRKRMTVAPSLTSPASIPTS